jgi:hypothetical protein
MFDLPIDKICRSILQSANLMLARRMSKSFKPLLKKWKKRKKKKKEKEKEKKGVINIVEGFGWN